MPILLKQLLVLLTLFCVLSRLVYAGLAEGMAAYEKGEYSLALSELKPLAEQSDALAQFKLGLLYTMGTIEVPKDAKQAVFWFQKSAKLGNAEAQLWLGMMYAQGNALPQNEKMAAFWIRKSADQGNVEAENWLGFMYAQGQGVPKNSKQAVLWYTKAAEQGHAVAQYDLGMIYLKEELESVPLEQAAYWLRKSAEQGNKEAQCKLGIMYGLGEGVEQNNVEAYQWLILANGKEVIDKEDSEITTALNIIAKKMTPLQIKQAQTLARDWKQQHPD
jgi:TPR repeat protein